MDVITGSGAIPVLVLPECATGEHFPEGYSQESLDRCSNCGSTLFRNYNEDVPEGLFIHQICAVCNQRLGGILDPWLKKMHYYNGDYQHPFMCIEIKEQDLASFVYDNTKDEPEALQFVAHLENLGYHVELPVVVVPGYAEIEDSENSKQNANE